MTVHRKASVLMVAMLAVFLYWLWPVADTQRSASFSNEPINATGSAQPEWSLPTKDTPVTSAKQANDTANDPLRLRATNTPPRKHDQPQSAAQEQQERMTWLLRRRMTAIRQANVMALADVPADVVLALAKLDIAKAQHELEQLSALGVHGSDRLLASMAIRKTELAPCLPYTDITAKNVPIVTLARHDQQLREAIQAVPPEVASRIAGTPPVFEVTEVLAACGELTVDPEDALRRVLQNAARDDENRNFILRFVKTHIPLLPERAPDKEGNPRPPDSETIQAEIAERIRWHLTYRGTVIGDRNHLRKATTDAEAYPSLFALAGGALYLLSREGNPDDFTRAKRYLEQAVETGELIALEFHGNELMRHAETMPEGYRIALFARHLNERGCYPGDYLAEWARQYRLVEAQAQAMSPVTLDIVREDAEKFIKSQAPKAYEHLHCR